MWQKSISPCLLASGSSSCLALDGSRPWQCRSAMHPENLSSHPPQTSSTCHVISKKNPSITCSWSWTRRRFSASTILNSSPVVSLGSKMETSATLQSPEEETQNNKKFYIEPEVGGHVNNSTNPRRCHQVIFCISIYALGIVGMKGMSALQ